MSVNFGCFGETEFEVDSVGVRKSALVVLSESEVEGGIGKDAPGGEELEADAAEIPATEEEGHCDE